MIEIRCGCGARLKAKEESAGKSIRCPKCDKLVKVPPSEMDERDRDDDFRDRVTARRDAPRSRPREEDDDPRSRRRPVDDDGPRRRRFDENEDDDRPRGRQAKKSGGNGTLFLTLGIVAVVLLGAGAGGYFLFLRPAGNPGPAPVGGQKPGGDAPAPAGPPQVADNFAFRPTFHTQGRQVSAGSAFLVKVDNFDRPLLLSALHLLGPAGGYPKDVPGTNVPGVVLGITVKDMFGAQLRRLPVTGIALPDTAPMGKPSGMGDIIAFWVQQDASLQPAPLAKSGPKVGDSVWLAYPNAGDPQQRLYKARVDTIRNGTVEYTFDDTDLKIPGTSGAPLLNGAGEVVGIQLGGGKNGMRVLGVANPVDTFRAGLVELCQKNQPKMVDTKPPDTNPEKKPDPKPPDSKPPDNGKSREYVVKTGEFSILVPALATAAKESKRGIPKQGLTLVVISELPDKTALQVMASRAQGSADEQIDAVLDSLQTSFKGEIVDEGPLNFPGGTGASLVLRVPGGALARIRVIVHQNRMYQVTALGPETTEHTKAILEFLDSFKVRTK